MKYVGYLLSLFSLLLCVACEKEDEPVIEQEPGRTVLVYIAADNNLSSSVEGDLSMMELGLQGADMRNGNLLAYVDRRNQNPQLIRFVQEKDSVRREVIENYPIDHSSATPERLGEVLRQVTQAFPSDHYGLILWPVGLAVFFLQILFERFVRGRNHRLQ